MQDMHDDEDFTPMHFARPEEMAIQAYLELCRTDKTAYSNVAERMVAAIGEPEYVDTSKDPRLGRIFYNRTVKTYAPFKDFFGLEDVIERIVGFFKHASQGLEEKKQILYLLGPVGGGKSSLAVRLRKLIERMPIYVLAVPNPQNPREPIVSPIFESPLWLFDQLNDGERLEKKYQIPRHRLLEYACISPWAMKRLEEFKGDWRKFRVLKMYPSGMRRICAIKTEPGDENNQDISTLVGKVNIRMIEQFNQNDPDAYSFSGGLNRSTQGVMEFVEMFKAPLKMLNPLLTATQDGNYALNESTGSAPWAGIVVAHSNESEWQSFRNNKNNEAFLDRVQTIKVPYCLRVSEEKKIYQKLLDNSELKEAPIAEHTLDMLARFSVLTRLKPHGNSSLFSKMRVYDGESLKDTDPHAKSLQEYRDAAGVNEGMDGRSTRDAYKVLSATFNFDSEEVAADPIHLMYVLEDQIKQQQLPTETESTQLGFIKNELSPKFAEQVGKVIQRAFLENYQEYGQNMYDRYLNFADAWVEDADYKDPDTGQTMNKQALEAQLSKIEKPAGIANPKDFRHEVVKFAVRHRSKHDGNNPVWNKYEKIREVIEARVFASWDEILPVISFTKKQDAKTQEQHDQFVKRLTEHGYTPRQVRRLVEWYMQIKQSR